MPSIKHISWLVFIGFNLFAFSYFLLIGELSATAINIFLAVIWTNAPILISSQVSERFSKDLQNTWLNPFNLFIPLLVGLLGVYLLTREIASNNPNTLIFLYTPVLQTIVFAIGAGLTLVLAIFANRPTNKVVLYLGSFCVFALFSILCTPLFFFFNIDKKVSSIETFEKLAQEYPQPTPDELSPDDEFWLKSISHEGGALNFNYVLVDSADEELKSLYRQPPTDDDYSDICDSPNLQTFLHQGARFKTTYHSASNELLSTFTLDLKECNQWRTHHSIQ